jgi:hypothetical protein
VRNIVYTGGFELPNKNAAAFRVLSNAKILRELGFNVILLGLDKTLKNSETIFKYAADFDGFECYALAYPKTIKEWVTYLVGRKQQPEFIGKIKELDTIVYYNFPAIAMLRLIVFCKNKGTKNVADITEWYSAKGMGWFKGFLKFIDTNLRVKFVTNYCSGIITTSKYLTEYYNDKGLTTLELPTLFDSKQFFHPKMSKKNKKINFLYVGSPFEVTRAMKNRSSVKERLDKVIDSFANKSTSKYILNIVGVSKQDYLKVYPEDRFKLDLMNNSLFFFGVLPNTQVKTFLNSADFTIFFRDENKVTLAGFPSKLAESITAGIPVVTNKMVSLEPYNANTSILCSEFAEESELITKCIQMNFKEINTLKVKAYESKMFDFRQYIEATKEFLDATSPK